MLYPASPMRSTGTFLKRIGHRWWLVSNCRAAPRMVVWQPDRIIRYGGENAGVTLLFSPLPCLAELSNAWLGSREGAETPC